MPPDTLFDQYHCGLTADDLHTPMPPQPIDATAFDWPRPAKRKSRFENAMDLLEPTTRALN